MIDVQGLNVVVTGVIGGESRGTAAAKLQQAGATVQSTVTGTTQLLVTGGKVGKAKTQKAAELGVRVVAWEEVWRAPATVRIVDIDTRLAEAEAEIASIGRTDPGHSVRVPVRQIAPQLAKGAELPTGPGWWYEVKWDGHRGIATVCNGRVAIQSRSGKSDYAEQFPEIVAALAKLPDCVLDGELVVLDGNGGSNLELLGTGPARYVVFDVLEDRGRDLRALTLEERRDYLDEIVSLSDGELIAVSPVFEDGEELLAEVARRGLEGIVAKRRSSRYAEGTRTSDWIKVKVRNEQEFVVIGHLPGKGEMLGHAGSFLLAVNEDGEDGRELVFCGKVGSGGTVAEGDAVRDLLTAVEEAPLEFDPKKELTLLERREITWVKPDVVLQVAFQRWTEDGRLWHPSWKGVREDKAAQDVRRERAAGRHERRHRGR